VNLTSDCQVPLRRGTSSSVHGYWLLKFLRHLGNGISAVGVPLAFAVITCFLLCSWSVARAAGDVSCQDILRSIELHDGLLNTVDATYSLRHRFQIDREARLRAWKSQGIQVEKLGDWVPKDYDMHGRFVKDGMRLRREASKWEPGRSRADEFEDITTVYTGEVVRSLDSLHKSGAIQPAEDHRPMVLQELNPLHWGWSYGAQPLGEFLRQGQLAIEGEEILSGTDTIALHVSYPNKYYRVWIAPTRGYRFVRLEKYTLANDLVMRFSCELTEHNGLWICDSGTWEMFNLSGDGGPEVEQIVQMQCESVQVNEGIAPSTFELEFPPGTSVADHILNTGYRVGGLLTGGEQASNLKADELAQAIEEPHAAKPIDSKTPPQSFPEEARGGTKSVGTDDMVVVGLLAVGGFVVAGFILVWKKVRTRAGRPN